MGMTQGILFLLGLTTFLFSTSQSTKKKSVFIMPKNSHAINFMWLVLDSLLYPHT